jgi:hypothetical protein
VGGCYNRQLTVVVPRAQTRFMLGFGIYQPAGGLGGWGLSCEAGSCGRGLLLGEECKILA